MLKEKDLLKRVLAGDLKAQEIFTAQFRPRLLRTCAYILGASAGEAEDVVQETFHFALPRLKHAPDAHLYAWLRQICLRLCYTRLNDRERFPAWTDPDLGVPQSRPRKG